MNNDTKKLIIILAIGAILRGLLLMFFWDKPLTIVDERHYQAIAENILYQHHFSLTGENSTAIRPPLYPFFLSAVYSLRGGVHLNLVRIVQIFISLGIIYLVYLTGRKLFTSNIALTGALIFSVYPSFIVFTHFLLTELLFTLFLMLFLLFFISFLQRPNRSDLVIAGVCLGLGALTRSILFHFSFVLCAFIMLFVKQSWRAKLVSIALLMLSFSIVIAPWVIRNYQLYRSVVFIDTMGGLNMYMGNYQHTPLNRAWAAVDLPPEKSWYYGHENELAVMNEAQKQNWAMEKAKAFIIRHPALTLKRDMIKAANFWGLEREIIGAVTNNHYPLLNRTLTLLIIAPLILFSCMTVIVGGMVGLIYNFSSGKLIYGFLILLLVYFTGMHGLVFGHSRYHLPLIPLLAVMAAWTVKNVRIIFADKKNIRYTLSIISVSVFSIIWIREIVFVELSRFISN
jgi:4-amino-4-deoxy-L-arabinose transferase-like glycosyltransferase